jgi:hypothetical protein
MILNVLLSPRFRSFYWRTLMMAVASFLSFLVSSLNLFQLSPQITVVLGLILGEIAKSINNIYQGKLGGWKNI